MLFSHEFRLISSLSQNTCEWALRHECRTTKSLRLNECFYGTRYIPNQHVFAWTYHTNIKNQHYVWVCVCNYPPHVTYMTMVHSVNLVLGLNRIMGMYWRLAISAPWGQPKSQGLDIWGSCTNKSWLIVSVTLLCTMVSILCYYNFMWRYSNSDMIVTLSA